MDYDETMGDPRLTAFALGELEGAERAAFERELTADPVLRSELEEVRRAVAVFEAGFSSEELEDAELAPLQRTRVLAAVEAPLASSGSHPRGGRVVLAAAGMAAAVLALLGSRFVARPEAADDLIAEAPTPDTIALGATLEFHATGGFNPASQPSDTPGLLAAPSAPDVMYVARSGAAPAAGLSILDLDGYEGTYGVEFRGLGAPAGQPSAGYFFDYGAGTVHLGNADPQPDWSGQHLYDISRVLVEPRYVTGFPKANRLEFGDPFGKPDIVPTGPADESYPLFQENLAQSPEAQPLSTFSIDVDTASYANVRRFLQNGQRPPVDAVRVEELVNYFSYDYARPDGERPFAVDAELGECPWAEGHQLLRIGLRGRPSSFEGRAPVNVVFLIDVSGSMKDADKLPLLKDALRLLVGQLTEDDSIAIVTYADDARVHLAATHGGAHERILAAVESLSANGSTNGEGGLRLAYEIAGKNLREDGVDRVLLASDGDFNVGISDEGELETFIAEQSAGGVELTVLGFGEDNLKDSKLEVLSGRGNGNYFYVDGLREARKVLVTDLGANFETIASDVKIQVDFNPAHVASYRLIGYETRALANRDFADDTKDAGEIGPDHRVTALYEIVPAGLVKAGVRPSKYAAEPVETEATASDELGSIRLRYKAPGATESVEFEEPVLAGARPFASLTADTRFATAVTAFGLALRNSKHRGTATLEDVSRWALDALGDDPEGLRTEFCDLVGKARELGVR